GGGLLDGGGRRTAPRQRAGEPDALVGAGAGDRPPRERRLAPVRLPAVGPAPRLPFPRPRLLAHPRAARPPRIDLSAREKTRRSSDPRRLLARHSFRPRGYWCSTPGAGFARASEGGLGGVFRDPPDVLSARRAAPPTRRPPP